MSGLELAIPKRRGGQRFARTFFRRRPVTGVASGSYLTFMFVRLGAASVGDPWVPLEDDKCRSTNLSDSVHGRIVKLTPFIHADVESDTCDEGEGSVGEMLDFLDTVYDLSRRGEDDQAIDVIFEYVNNLLVEGKFDVCDEIFAEVDLAGLPAVLMVSFLTITAAAKPKLKRRHWFFNLIRRAVASKRGEKAADRLLDGLD